METRPRHHRLRYLIGGDFSELAWTEWGPADGAPVLCVHGLTRNGRDFDVLAAALAARGRRVLCPDLPGRGASAWLAQPALYVPPSYVQALSHLIARLDGPVDYVGTSLGGICGMLIAAAEHAPLRRFVLNDIGSSVPGEAIARISAYVRTPLVFDSLAALEAHLREVHAPFGALSDAEWAHMAATSHRVLPDGRFGMHYDPAIAVPFLAGNTGTVDLGPVWDRVRVPVLLIRGAESDVLPAEVAAAMAARENVEFWELPEIGHAPALMEPRQVERVAAFLGA